MVEKYHQDGGNTPLSFVDILQVMNSEGGFTRSVLATSEGLRVASVPDNSDSELAGAMVALLQNIGEETQGQLGMPPVDEVTIRTEDRTHLVCRRIGSGDDCLSLCAVVPANLPYRRATNKAVRRIREILDS